MPTQAIKERLETLIPQIRRRQSVPLAGAPRRPFFQAGALILAVGVGFAFSLAEHTRRLATTFLDQEVNGFKFDVFLADSADRPFIEERLLTTSGVRSVRFVPKEEALGRAQENPALAESLKWVVRNPLPESFDVDWTPSFLLSGNVPASAESWADLPGVLSLAFDRPRLDRMALLGRIVNQWDVIFSSLFWVGAVLCFLGVGRLVRRGAARSLNSFLLAAAAGALCGGVGATAVWLWLGSWAGAGIVAGGAVGALAFLGRDVANG